MTVVLWVFRILLAALFLFAGIMKLVGAEMEVADLRDGRARAMVSLRDRLAEIAGAILLLVPAVSAFGALLLLAVDIGAFVAQVTVLHQDWIHTVVIGVVLAGSSISSAGRSSTACAERR